MHFYHKYELPAIVNERGDKRIFVFGDSFAQLVRMAKPIRHVSWMSHLALHLDAQVHSYGISGAAESTILYTYLETYSEERDFTIIFHTIIVVYFLKYSSFIYNYGTFYSIYI